MADNFTQAGGLPAGYADLLAAARQQLVRKPDGTLGPAPQYGAPTSLEQIYGGILPSQPPTVLTSRSVNTVPVDTMTGRPLLGFEADTMAATRAEQAGIRPAFTAGTQPAGTVAMPPGARPASVDQAFAQMGIQPSGGLGRGQPVRSAQAADPFGTHVVGGYQDRLPANDGGEAGFLAAFGPQGDNAALGAITQATRAGVMPLRGRPQTPYMTSPSYMTTPGSPFAAAPDSSSITIRRGDTVSALAKQLGMTTQQFASAYGIKDPNKIIAGQTLTRGMAAPAPGRVTIPTKTPTSRGSLVAVLKTPKETRAERFSNLDEFGMIK